MVKRGEQEKRMSDRTEETIGEMPTLGREEPQRPSREPVWKSEESIGELTTRGPGETVDKGTSGPVLEPHVPVWEPGKSIGELTTLKPEGIVDDGRTDGARRWKAGEEILGRYVVERELGQGGMGVVYGCFDKVGGVRVAVKCLPPELGHNSVEMEEVRENFQLVYGLGHPNIAGVRQLEKDANGEYYLVMDVAEGENLRVWLRRKWKAGGVSLAEAVGVLRQVASALDYAHGEKVVHRDVKPGNVMIDGRGRVKVLDFGLAAQIRTSLSRASHVYRETSGTGPYMAPEQWEGQPQDGAADQYALGVMTYEMLAERLPFENSELAVLKDAVLHGVVREIPGVDKRAMRALRRALAKRADERWESCGAFVEALAGKRVGWGGRWNARGKTLMGWGAALVLVLLVMGWWWWWEWGRENLGETPVPRQATADLSQQATKEAAAAEKRKAEEEPKREKTERAQAAWEYVEGQRMAQAPEADCPEGSRHREISLDLGNGVMLEMVHCPGVAANFWMGKYEVTQEQWQQITGKTPSCFGGKPNNPVESVSWNDCQDFVKALNTLPAVQDSGLSFRLPEDREWKKACRAGAPESEDYCQLEDGTYITEKTLSRVARYGHPDEGPVEVGSYEANAWGLYDMLGNVWEWTQPTEGGVHVIRGGGFEEAAKDCTAIVSCKLSPNINISEKYLGLRLAADGRASTK